MHKLQATVAGLLIVAAGLTACSSGSSGPRTAASPAGATASATPTEAPPVARNPADRRAAEGIARPSVGCNRPVAAPGNTTVRFSSAGRAGTYVRELPPAYRRHQPLPLVVDLHGYAESAALQAPLSALGTLGAKQGFVTVTPEISGPVPNWIPDLDGPDVAWFGALLDSLEGSLCLDERRVFVTGYSNGAIFTSSLVCAYADRIAAAAPVAGLRDIPGCAPSRRVPLIVFHGTADTYVPFDGSPSRSAAALPAPDGSGRTLGDLKDADLPGAAITRSVVDGGSALPDILTAWAGREGCTGAPASSGIGPDVTLVRYPCPPGTALELYRIEGGGHTWPGSRGTAAIASAVGRTTFTIDADTLMWDFFAKHPLP